MQCNWVNSTVSDMVGGIIDFQFLVIQSIAARRIWVTVCQECFGRFSMAKFSRARPGERYKGMSDVGDKAKKKKGGPESFVQPQSVCRRPPFFPTLSNKGSKIGL